MSVLQTFVPKLFSPFPAAANTNSIPFFHSGNPNPSFRSPPRNPRRHSKPSLHLAASATPNSTPSPNPDPSPNPKPPKPRGRRPTPKAPPEATAAGTPDGVVSATIPRKPRRGRRSEAAAVEDFVRDSLERTFTSIRQKNAGVLEGKEEVLKRRDEERWDGGEGLEGGGGSREEVVEEDDPDWPADAEVGWGTRASDYFEKHPIKNEVVDGVEIDWEGEMEEGWVKEINCLEWEKFAFHPSPLIVLVFERYNRTADNWKFLKELEKAAKVYWSAKDRLPPRTIKIDINIERDLAYALKVKECPQLLFLRGNRILYREKEIRTADELVHMIAHFYYNAKRPSWIDDAAVAPPF